MIPKIIHQTGPKDKKLWPAEWEYATASWKKVYSEHEHMFWTDDDLENLMKEKFSKYSDVWYDYPNNIMRTDLGRIMILYEYGGIYSDLDVYCRRKFCDEMDHDKVNLLSEPGGLVPGTGMIHPNYSNCLMASPPKLNYWIEVLDIAQDIWKNGEKAESIKNKNEWGLLEFATILWVTGPALLENHPETKSQKILQIHGKSVKYPVFHIATGSWWQNDKFPHKLNHFKGNSCR